MKKAIRIVLAAALAAALAPGLGGAPEALAELSGAQAQLVKTAQSGGGGAEPLAAYEAPERFTGAWTGVNGLVTVMADAVVELPDADRIPTASVTRRDFNQTDLDTFMRVFVRGEPFYQEQFMTRQEAQARLEKFEAMQRGDIPLEGDATMEALPQIIADYTAYIQTLPNEGERFPASASFRETDFGDEMQGCAEVDGKTVHLNVMNVPNFWDKAVFYAEGFGDWNDSNAVLSRYVDGELPHDRIFPAFEPEEALRMGDALVEELGLENVVCDQIEPVFFAEQKYLYGDADGGTWERMDPDRLVKATGYELRYVRCVDGFPIRYTTHAGLAVEHDASHDAVWAYEEITVCVTEEGAVYFSWSSPYTEPVLQVEDTRLLPFADIASVAGRMMMVKYSYLEDSNAADGVRRTAEFNLDSVELGLMRIKDKDIPDGGLLVPVWDFWGTETIHGPETDYEYDRDIYLTLNAIDGTMIDRDLGY